MLKMRTIKQAITELRCNDPSTAISERAIKRLIDSNVIPVVKIGRKTLFDMENLEEYLHNGTPKHETSVSGMIRPVKL